MAAAGAAVGAAEALKRRRKFFERGVDRAFVSAWKDEGAEDPPGAGQLIDMPMRALLLAQVARDPGRQSSRPPRRAAIEIEPWRERGSFCAGLHGERRSKRDKQRIGARLSRRSNGGSDEDRRRPAHSCPARRSGGLKPKALASASGSSVPSRNLL